MGFDSLFNKLGHNIAHYVGSHKAVIHAAIDDAAKAAVAATSIAAALGEPVGVAAEIARVADGLSKVDKAVTEESSAGTLSQHASDLATLATGLVGSGDIGVKNPQTQAAVATVATKVQSVVGALETAAEAKTASTAKAAG